MNYEKAIKCYEELLPLTEKFSHRALAYSMIQILAQIIFDSNDIEKAKNYVFDGLDFAIEQQIKFKEENE